MGKRQVFQALQADRTVPRAPGWGTQSHSVLPISSSPSEPPQSCQKVSHRPRPSLHAAGWKNPEGQTTPSLHHHQHPQDHPPTLCHPPRGAQPLPHHPRAANRRCLSFQRKEWLQCGAEPGANSWPGLCSPAQSLPCTGRIPAASSQAAGQE